jgi:hypothetical protein
MLSFKSNFGHKSIKMSPFKALYGWSYRTLLSWSESSERVIFDPDIVTEAEEKVKQIHTNILIANLVKRATPTRDDVSWSLKLVIKYTFEFLQ